MELVLTRLQLDLELKKLELRYRCRHARPACRHRDEKHKVGQLRERFFLQELMRPDSERANLRRKKRGPEKVSFRHHGWSTAKVSFSLSTKRGMSNDPSQLLWPSTVVALQKRPMRSRATACKPCMQHHLLRTLN